MVWNTDDADNADVRGFLFVFLNADDTDDADFRGLFISLSAQIRVIRVICVLLNFDIFL